LSVGAAAGQISIEQASVRQELEKRQQGFNSKGETQGRSRLGQALIFCFFWIKPEEEVLHWSKIILF